MSQSVAASNACAVTTRAPRRTPSRVLYVSAAPPVPSKIGPARRNFHIIDQLARFYDVSVLSLGSERHAAMFGEAFRARVPRAHFAPYRGGTRQNFARKVWRTLANRCDFGPTREPALRRLCGEVAGDGAFDAIVLSSVLLRGLPLPAGVPIVGDTHNVEFDVLRRTAGSADAWGRRAYASAQWRATRREESRAARGVDLLMATSERDARVFGDELAVSDVEVVPNGIDLAEFAPASRAGQPGVILFSGLMSYYPNQQAVRWFLDRVFPTVLRHVPGATLVVAGAAPPRWLLDRAGARLRVTGAVPDMRPFLEEASVFVAPLRIGGGTRVKILEAQAVGRPVVSTAIGAEGLMARHGESILISDDPDVFAGHVRDVLTDDGLAGRIADEGRRGVVRHYDWNHIGDHMQRLLQRRAGLVARPDAPPR